MTLPDRFPLSSRLTAAGGVLLLAFAVVYGALAWRAVKDEQVSRMQTVLEIAQKATNGYFVETEAALEGLAMDLQAGGGLADVERNAAVVRRFKRLHPSLTAVNLLDTRGKVLATATTQARAALPPITQVRASSFGEFLARLERTTRMDLGRPLKASISPGWFFPIRYVLRGADGKPVAFISATLPVEVLQRFWSNAPVVAKSSLGLIRDDGYLISLFPTPADSSQDAVYGSARSGIVPRGHDGEAHTHYAEGDSSILGQPGGYAWQRLENYPITMFVATPLAEYWRAWWVAVRVPFLLTALLAAAGVLTTSVLRARKLALEAQRRRAEEALAEKRIAERANRSKTEFMARMSHELRTPLNAMLGFTQILQRDTPGTLVPEQRRDLQHVLHAGQHLLWLIDDLLDLARVEAGTLRLQLGDVEAIEVVRDAMSQIAAEAEAQGVRLELDAPREPMPPVLADRTRLRQVVLNLLSNAVKYNSRGGTVTLWLRAEGERLRLAVRDTGAGLSEAELGQLFQPFNRLGREASGVQGTGIGLVVTRSLVEQMAGTLTVASEAGVGSEFRIELPLSPTRAGADGAAATVVDAPAAGAPPAFEACGDVIYIDDDEVNRLLMQAYLRVRPKVSLRLAGSGAEGLAMARAARPDLLLIDLMMPGMNGLQVLAAVRAHPALRDVPCLAISANAMPEEIDAAMRAGFDSYLVKPLAVDALLSELDRRLGSGVQASQVALDKVT